MKKRLFSLLLALMMVFTLAPAAFAVDLTTLPGVSESKPVAVPGTIELRKSGADWSTARQELTVSMTEADMNSTVDFRVVLNTSPIKNAIDEWYKAAADLFNDDVLFETMLADWNVAGTFEIAITYPSEFTIPDEYTAADASTNMTGFNSEAKNLFYEVGRVISGNTCTITIGVKNVDGGDDGISAKALYDDIHGADTYLSSLLFTVEGVSTTPFTGTRTVKGEMNGFTTLHSLDGGREDFNVYFETKEIRAHLTKYTPGSAVVASDYKVTFNIDGDTDLVDSMYAKGTVKAEELPTPPYKSGYTFDGWYTDSELTQKVTDSIKVNKRMALYGHWVSDTLETEKHFAYVIGYPDETVRPNNNITREEAAAIFYRLLRDDAREKIYSTENGFADVAPERWSNTAISTMANGGFIIGRDSDTFDPEADITRAEFATMATRFAMLLDDSGAEFADIDGHWAKDYILKAATTGWIYGDGDDTFRPEDFITRAEVMAIINRILARKVDEKGIHDDAKIWSDVSAKEWYYEDVIEATNSHDFTRNSDGITETWTEITPNKEW